MANKGGLGFLPPIATKSLPSRFFLLLELGESNGTVGKATFDSFGLFTRRQVLDFRFLFAFLLSFHFPVC